jgi:ferredoxin
MPHVVTGNCSDCRFTDCVLVCPVACFHGDDHRMYIDPIACVDCAACVPACPVHAISASADLSQDQQMWIQINADKSGSTPVIRSKQTPLAGAEERRAALGYGPS